MLNRALSMMLGCLSHVLSWEGVGLLPVMLRLPGPQ